MDEMNELYYRLPYVKEFDAVVTGCAPGKSGFEVTLSQTVFYPEGGGQLADSGFIGEAAVGDTRRRGDAIIHYADRALQVGSTQHCAIDWQKRFDHMQAHSGEHIVSGLIHRRFGYDNVGFHMAADKVTVDFNGVISEEQLAELEREANACVYANLPVRVFFPSPEELAALDYRSKKELSGIVRLVEFPGVDLCACCGTHVERTGEIGLIKFVSMARYKGGVRIEMLCGRLAMQDYARKNEQEREIGRIFSAKPYETVEAVRQYVAAAEAAEARASELARRYFELRAAQFPAGGGLLVDFEDGFKPVELRRFCDALVAGGKAKTATVLSPAENNGKKGWNYVICASEPVLRDAVKTLNKELNGRGGGDPTLVQGTFFAERAEIERALEATFR
ncbi:MAG: alanyl-tRNA editing protein [Pyramidobacter sp.]|uniref:alanyl-tRNA editing protein n=1 Tax=Pyramidobacter sp. TaxID=1943581 RepID=UPI002A83A7D7|nr:alanyl-tRNA editing protein [Pyramidobacter sp.]MDY4031693.1 alanyl-tRNA editing protein [Pyramidobacter sp.]